MHKYNVSQTNPTDSGCLRSTQALCLRNACAIISLAHLINLNKYVVTFVCVDVQIKLLIAQGPACKKTYNIDLENANRSNTDHTKVCTAPRVK